MRGEVHATLPGTTSTPDSSSLKILLIAQEDRTTLTETWNWSQLGTVSDIWYPSLKGSSQKVFFFPKMPALTSLTVLEFCPCWDCSLTRILHEDSPRRSVAPEGFPYAWQALWHFKYLSYPRMFLPWNLTFSLPIAVWYHKLKHIKLFLCGLKIRVLALNSQDSDWTELLRQQLFHRGLKLLKNS